jgi:hypothetical protein
MIPFLVVFAACSLVLLGVYLGISIAREKPSDYEDIGDSVERVGQHYVYGLDASLEDTTPPTVPCEGAECKAVQDAENYVNLIWG